MLYREIKDNAYNEHFTSVSLQRRESVQVGAVLTPLSSLSRAAGETQLFPMRGNANVPSSSGLAMGTAVMGVLPSPEHRGSAVMKTTVNR